MKKINSLESIFGGKTPFTKELAIWSSAGLAVVHAGKSNCYETLGFVTLAITARYLPDSLYTAVENPVKSAVVGFAGILKQGCSDIAGFFSSVKTDVSVEVGGVEII